MATVIPRTLNAIDWEQWTPTERATLMFVMRGTDVLLIHKKRGLGAGKINGPGGRLEQGETPLMGAIRETEEEVCVTPLAPQPAGTLRFQFTDGYSLQAYLFIAHNHTGTPSETHEAVPHWIPINQLPFERMWADDPHWLPNVLAGDSVNGRFIFDGETMLDFHIEHSPHS